MVTIDVAKFGQEIIEKGGAILINRAPHAGEVERLYGVFARVSDKFR